MQYVTYENFIQFGLFVIALIGLVYTICQKTKNNRPGLEN